MISLTLAIVTMKTLQLLLSLQKFTKEVGQPAACGLAIHSSHNQTLFPLVAPKARNLKKTKT